MVEFWWESGVLDSTTYVNVLHLWWSVTHKMWNRSYEISPTYALGWRLWGLYRVGPLGAPVLPLIVPEDCPELSLGLTLLTREDSLTNRFHVTDTFLWHSKAAKKVLGIINLGSLSSYWPWNLSFFIEKLVTEERMSEAISGKGQENVHFCSRPRAGTWTPPRPPQPFPKGRGPE